MKKTFLTLFLLCLGITAMAQQWTSISKSNPAEPKVTLVSSSESKIVVDFSLGGFNMNKVTTPNGLQQIISVPRMVSMLEAGAPDLPQIPVPAVIGDRAEMQVKVVASEYTDYENIEVAPSKGNFSRQINPDDVPYTYGEMYSQDAFYPTQQAYLETPYIIRDFRGQNIMVRPFAYNPVSKILRVYHHMTIEMVKVSDNGVNQKLSSKVGSVKVDPQVIAAYERRFINYGQQGAKYTFLEDAGEMLVICPENYLNAMQPFVDWKNQSGRPTTMVSLADAGGNTADNIKSYIQNYYNDASHNLTFVLFVGDYSDITPYSLSGGYSDNWFGMLEGNDYYVEVLVGRFSALSAADVTNQVNKVIYYERDMPATATWLNQGIGIGANEGAGSGHQGGEADYVHMDYVRDTLLHYTYETVTQQYSGVGSGTSANAISTDVNNGASIINYCNHGSVTSWAVASYSVDHVNALTNDYKWPYIISVACYNGQFGGTSDCFAEAWMKATNNSTGAPTGAIGGMFSWISQPWTPPMTGQDEMVRIITEWVGGDQFNHTMGGAMLNGNEYILDTHTDSNGSNTHNTWLLFGDPSLLLRTDNPTAMNVTCNPSQLLVGMSSLAVSVNGVEYGIATLMMDGEVLSSAKIENGTANLSFDALTNVGEATLTVIAYNKVTSIQTIDVIPADGAYITVDGFAPGSALVGEQTTMTINFKNVGNDATSGAVEVSLSCDDDRLNFQNSTGQIAALGGNATATLGDFVFEIAEGVEDGTVFPITVTSTCGSETWVNTVKVTASAPVLTISEFTSTELMPGQSGTLTFTITNNGSAAAQNAQFQVSCNAPGVGLTNNTFNIGTLAAGASTTKTVNISIASNVSYGTSFNLNYTLTATHFSATGVQGIVAGIITEGFESGDFTAMEWELAGSVNWTIDDTEHYAGSKSAKSGAITHSEQSDLSVNVTVLSAGNISFYYKVSSESNYDKLHFYIDNVEKGVWSGTVNWTQATYEVATGSHTFKWSYTKDVSVSSGSDCAWIDEVEFPPIMVNAAPEPGLMGDVNLDESLTISDVIILLRHVMGGVSLSDEALALADVNNDGTVNISDVIVLLRQIMN